MAISDISLQELYMLGLKALQDAENMSRSDLRQDMYIKSRRYFEQAMNLVESLELFSENETVEDVATNDLRYLLIPAYLAKISISSECGSNRLNTFTKAETYLKKFFHTIVKYGLGNKEIERILESNDEVPTAPAGLDLDSAMKSRNEKIEKYKMMKQLEIRIDDLDKQINSGHHMDDEIVREYYLNLIKKWIAESLDSLEREVRPALFFERTSKCQKSPDPSTSKPTNPKIPSSITIVKNELQKQVFGLGYPSRPTVTVDEFISKKISDGDLAFESHKEIYANSLQRYAENPTLLRDQEELSDVEQEEKAERDDAAELNRKRQWDEFKDDNPRGSGNRHNMG